MLKMWFSGRMIAITCVSSNHFRHICHLHKHSQHTSCNLSLTYWLHFFWNFQIYLLRTQFPDMGVIISVPALWHHLARPVFIGVLRVSGQSELAYIMCKPGTLALHGHMYISVANNILYFYLHQVKGMRKGRIPYNALLSVLQPLHQIAVDIKIVQHSVKIIVHIMISFK